MINSSFPRALSHLRQQKGVSQRVAARELLVSQALLSHYENGIREPGLNFVQRACDYYGVSADYLLGRTLSPDGAAVIDAEHLRELSASGKTGANPDSLGLLARTLLGEGLDFLLEALTKTGNEEVIRTAAGYFNTTIYTAFRHLREAAETAGQAAAPQRAALAGTIDLLTSELDYLSALLAHARSGGDFPDLKADSPAEASARHQALLHIVRLAAARMPGRPGGERF